MRQSCILVWQPKQKSRRCYFLDSASWCDVSSLGRIMGGRHKHRSAGATMAAEAA
jgi:hypothetical protein